MGECFKCGVSDERVLLLDTITSEGFEQVCRKCSFDIDTPIIKKVPQEKLRESQLKKSVYERLSDNAGLDPIAHRKQIAIEKKRKETISSQDIELHDIVKKNLNLNVEKSEKYNNNFHWIIMRYRRAKKITQKELAREIGEPEEAIKMLEKGILPRGSETIMKKLESYLGVNLFKVKPEPLSKSTISIDKMRQEFERKIEEDPEIIFDRQNPERLTIDDLREIKKIEFKQNPRIFEKSTETKFMIDGEEIQIPKEKIDVKNEPEFIGKQIDEEKSGKKALTDEEIGYLIFGKR